MPAKCAESLSSEVSTASAINELVGLARSIHLHPTEIAVDVTLSRDLTPVQTLKRNHIAANSVFGTTAEGLDDIRERGNPV